MDEEGSAEPLESLGRTIRALREAHRPKMTQSDLAELIGGAMTQADVSNYELGKVKLPRRPRLERIAAIFDVSLGELLARSSWTDADRYLLEDDEPSADPVVEALVAKLRRTPLAPAALKAIDAIVDQMAPFGASGEPITTAGAPPRRRRAPATGA